MSITHNMFSSQIENLIPREVRFDVAKQPDSITGKNTFSKKVAIALKDKENSEEYQIGVKEKIFSLLSKPQEEIRAGLTNFLNSAELFSIKDSELEDCRVIALVNKKEVVIHMLDGPNQASKMPISVPLQSNGHPEYEEVKKEAIRLLKDKVLARREP